LRWTSPWRCVAGMTTCRSTSCESSRRVPWVTDWVTTDAQRPPERAPTAGGGPEFRGPRALSSAHNPKVAGSNPCGVPLFNRGRWRRVSEPREAARNGRAGVQSTGPQQSRQRSTAGQRKTAAFQSPIEFWNAAGSEPEGRPCVDKSFGKCLGLRLAAAGCLGAAGRLRA
jgi:hypothetical protein